MIGYYLRLASRGLRRNPALTVLMVVAIAFGIGASMTTLTVLRVLSADPIPGKSHQLYYVQLEPRSATSVLPGDPLLEQLTRRDAENLLRDARGDRQAMMTGGEVAVEPERQDLAPFFVESRWTSTDFFAMFDVRFVVGRAWTAADDESRARVAVIGRALAEKLFGTVDVVGRAIKASGNDLRIVGVIDNWRVTPHFYDLNTGAFSDSEQLFAPISTALELRFNQQGSVDCWGDAPDPSVLGSPCVWAQYWVELADHSKRDAYRDYLVNYSHQQRIAGNFELPPNVALRDVRDWLDFKEVVPSDVRMQTWLALAFLVVCLINTVGLLLTKFLRRSSEIGVRRALGASKRSVFVQLLVEAAVVGLAGGALGLALAWLGLWAVRHQPTNYAELAHLDGAMLMLTFVFAIASTVVAGLFPAWRGCQITPAVQLKSH